MLLTDADFTRLYTYVKTHYGIDLSKKKPLISSRLSNVLLQDGYHDFTQYTDEIISGRHPEMVSAMLNRLTTNYTYFLREKEHFDFLKQTVLPELAARHAHDHTLSIWSAGCSSGEEPYTISMYLNEFFSSQPGNWDTRILATDISQNVLETAQAPSYNAEALAELPANWRQKYFIQTGNDRYTVSSALRQNVIFRPFNLMEPIRFKRKFDLIFCRNVMIYFDRPTKEALVQRFFQATVPGGYLFIGHSEGLDKERCPYQYLYPAIYQKDMPVHHRGGENECHRSFV